jgi:hypothetical protein
MLIPAFERKEEQVRERKDRSADACLGARLQFALPKPQIGNRVFTTVKPARLAGTAGAAILTNAG